MRGSIVGAVFLARDRGLDLDPHQLEFVGRVLGILGDPQSSTASEGRAIQAGVDSRTLIENLSKREREVLGLMAVRLSNQEIADRLGISIVTIKRHSANIYGKLGVHGRRDAVAKAFGLGLLGQG